jgi:CRISPR-associated protein Cas5d
MKHTVTVKVTGLLACFTRPEAKVERVSYLCMTPSAARGVLESILWKPQFTWVVHSIRVLRPVRFESIRRNEIQDTISVPVVQKWMKEDAAYRPYYTDSAGRKSAYGDHRVQRHTLALRDVAYVITAEPRLTDRANLPRTRPPDADRPDGPDTEEKYVAIFNRRVMRGQCFQQPYLGLREFVAEFAPSTEGETPDPTDTVLKSAEYSLGRMFYDFDFRTDNIPAPLFAPAILRHGVLDVDEMCANLMRETGTETNQ